jgi:hypothetical protein
MKDWAEDRYGLNDRPIYQYVAEAWEAQSFPLELFPSIPARCEAVIQADSLQIAYQRRVRNFQWLPLL